MLHRRLIARVVAALPLLLAAHAALAGTLGTIEATYNFHANYLAADPSRSFLYATTNSSLEIIDTQSLAQVKSIPLSAGGFGISLSADGNRLYVAGGTSNSVHVIDANSQTLLNSIPVGSMVRGVAAGLDNRLFVQTSDSNTWYYSQILQLDATTGTSRGPSVLGTGDVYSGDMQISPDRTTLYYGNFGLSPATLNKIDVSTSTPQILWESRRDLGSNGQQVVLSHDGSMLAYLTGSGYQNYKIPNFSTDDMSVIGIFPTGAYPNALAYSADDRWAFALHTVYPTAIDVYDTQSSARVAQFPALDRGSKMLVDRLSQHLFVSYNGTYHNYTNLVAYSTGHFVPEPGTFALAACGIIALAAAGIRRVGDRGERQPTSGKVCL